MPAYRLIIGTCRVLYGSSLAKTRAQTLPLKKPRAQTLCEGKVWASRLLWQGPTMTTTTTMMMTMTMLAAVCSTLSSPARFHQFSQPYCCDDSLATSSSRGRSLWVLQHRCCELNLSQLCCFQSNKPRDVIFAQAISPSLSREERWTLPHHRHEYNLSNLCDLVVARA